MILWSKEITISYEMPDEAILQWRYFMYFLDYGKWWKDAPDFDFTLPDNVAELIKERMIAKYGKK